MIANNLIIVKAKQEKTKITKLIHLNMVLIKVNYSTLKVLKNLNLKVRDKHRRVIEEIFKKGIKISEDLSLNKIV